MCFGNEGCSLRAFFRDTHPTWPRYHVTRQLRCLGHVGPEKTIRDTLIRSNKTHLQKNDTPADTPTPPRGLAVGFADFASTLAGRFSVRKSEYTLRKLRFFGSSRSTQPDAFGTGESRRTSASLIVDKFCRTDALVMIRRTIKPKIDFNGQDTLHLVYSKNRSKISNNSTLYHSSNVRITRR